VSPSPNPTATTINEQEPSAGSKEAAHHSDTENGNRLSWADRWSRWSKSSKAERMVHAYYDDSIQSVTLSREDAKKLATLVLRFDDYPGDPDLAFQQILECCSTFIVQALDLDSGNIRDKDAFMKAYEAEAARANVAAMHALDSIITHGKKAK
jgi:hypothetical protein